jgi:hypothetical protein
MRQNPERQSYTLSHIIVILFSTTFEGSSEVSDKLILFSLRSCRKYVAPKYGKCFSEQNYATI